MKEPPHPALAQGKVRHVGDPVAFVIAETREQAQSAAEAVVVDYEMLPAVVGVLDAIKRDAPLLFDEVVPTANSNRLTIARELVDTSF